MRLASILALLPGTASACAVCFGKVDGKQGLFNGIWWGIVVLLTTTMFMVGGIGYMLWKVEKNRPKEEGA